MTSARERILRAGGRLVFEKSFHSVGLAEILAEAETTKGGFYHFFKSKEEFGVELVRIGVEREIARMSSLLRNPTVNAYEGLELYWNAELGRLLAESCRHDSLIVKLGAEVANLSADMRAVMTNGLVKWRNVLLDVIERGKVEGSISANIVADQATILIQDLWNGALLRAGVEQSVAPVQQAIGIFRCFLKGDPIATAGTVKKQK